MFPVLIITKKTIKCMELLKMQIIANKTLQTPRKESFMSLN